MIALKSTSVGIAYLDTHQVQAKHTIRLGSCMEYVPRAPDIHLPPCSITGHEVKPKITSKCVF